MRVRTAAASFVLLGILGAVGSLARGDERLRTAPKSGDADEIQQLVKQLGADDFEAREKATKRLRALGEKALDAVEAARKSDDPEIRRRAESLGKDLQSLLEERIYRAMKDKFKDLPIDQFIDHLATRKEFDKPENWKRLLELAQVMTLRAGKVGDRKWDLPELDHKKLSTNREIQRPSYRSQKVCVDGLAVRVISLNDCILVSSGSIQGCGAVSRSIVFINGDLQRCTSIANSFVFCNGDLGRVPIIRNSVILTTGHFVGSTRADNNFFQVKSVGRHSIAQGNVYLNVGAVNCVRSVDNKFINGRQGPLEIVAFFNTARLGLEFSTRDAHARIDKIQDGKPFARAGLRAGDLVIATDQGDIPSAEELRKVLRRRLAGEHITLKVRRGENVVECKVKLAD